MNLPLQTRGINATPNREIRTSEYFIGDRESQQGREMKEKYRTGNVLSNVRESSLRFCEKDLRKVSKIPATANHKTARLPFQF